MGVARKPASQATNELIRDLMEFVRDQQIHNTKIMEAMMAAHTAQASVFQSWLEMFKPSATPQLSTTADERAVLREMREAEEWEPMALSMADALLKDLPNG